MRDDQRRQLPRLLLAPKKFRASSSVKERGPG